MDKDKKIRRRSDITYTFVRRYLAGGWKHRPSYGISYDGGGTVDTVDINDMMRADAGKGMENMTFQDFKLSSPLKTVCPF